MASRETLHECPVTGCKELVTQTRLACPKHWRRVPKDLRDELWAAFRERMWSPRHIRAIRACTEFLNQENQRGHVPTP